MRLVNVSGLPGSVHFSTNIIKRKRKQSHEPPSDESFLIYCQLNRLAEGTIHFTIHKVLSAVTASTIFTAKMSYSRLHFGVAPRSFLALDQMTR